MSSIFDAPRTLASGFDSTNLTAKQRFNFTEGQKLARDLVVVLRDGPEPEALTYTVWGAVGKLGVHAMIGFAVGLQKALVSTEAA